MTRQRARTSSQMLAAAVTLAAVLIMLAPLRRGPMENAARQAGWSPLLDLGGMADSAAFHRRDSAATSNTASVQVLFRQPTAPVP